MLRFTLFLLFVCLLAGTSVQARDERAPRGSDPGAGPAMAPPPRGETDDRRAQVRNMREEFRSIREQLYRQSSQPDPRRRIADEEPDPRLLRERSLRRLDPDEREGLRRAMREAAREHYGR